jgi:hypothetical protein
MQSANLLEFGSGGGGFIGQDKDVIATNFKFAEYSFTSKDRATGAITQTYEPSCVLQFDIEVVDAEDDAHRNATQYMPVGSLPEARLTELGWPIDKSKRKGGPGGYLPSQDNENPSTEGPFVILEGKTDIWNQCDYALFMTELINLGLGQFADRIAAQGVAALDGTRMHLVSKAKPKGKNAKADAQERTILVPSEIQSWGWDAGKATAATKPAAAKSAAKGATKAAATTTAAPAADAAPAGDDIDTQVIDIVQSVIAASGGELEHKNLAAKVFGSTASAGPNRTKLVQRAADANFIASLNGAFWLYDAATGKLSLLPS